MKLHIRRVATLRGFSPYSLAQTIDVPPQTVYSWTSGRTQPSYENMDKLCSALNCTMGELFEPERLTFEKVYKSKRLLKGLE